MFKLISPGDEGYLGAIEGYFKQRIANTRKLMALSARGEDLTFEVLLLCCCALDALGSLFLEDDQGEDGRKGKERFHELLWHYGETSGFRFDRVNLIALLRKIDDYIAQKSREGENVALPNVRSYIVAEIAKHDYHTGSAVDLDLPLQEVETSCHDLVGQDGQIGRWGWLSNVVRESTHAGVLYELYRCPAVHEAHVPGHWNSSGRKDGVPFYMPVIGEGVDFTFPENFLIQVVEQTLSRILYEHLTSQVLRP